MNTTGRGILQNAQPRMTIKLSDLHVGLVSFPCIMAISGS